MGKNPEPIVEGLYDTHDARGIRMKVSGDDWYRVHITPQGEVRVGNGTAPPVSIGGGLPGHEAADDPHTGYRLESAPITPGDLSFDPATQAAVDAIAFNVDDYGAVPGQDSTVAIQAAIDACNAAGGGTVTGKGNYLVSNLTLPSNVILWSPSANSYGFQQAARGFTLTATTTATGYMITIPVNAHNAGVVGVTLNGRGVVNADQSGIYASDGAKRCVFEKVGVYNMPMFGINLDKISGISYGHRVRSCDIFAGRRPVANLGPAERVAGLRINASDCDVDGNCEIQCGPADGTVDASLRRIAVWLGPLAAACTVQGVIGELSDIGIATESNYGRFMGCRADLNYGHGFWAGRVSTGSAQYNRFIGCLGLSNGQGAHNTYDNFHFESNGGVSNLNAAVGCVSSSLAANKHRYGFYDGGSTPTLTIAGNSFDSSCEDVGAATAARGGLNVLFAQTTVDGGRSAQVTVSGGGVINVGSARVLLINDGLTYTDFTGAPIGARLFIFTQVAAGAVLTHSAALRLKGGVSRTLNAYESLTLRRISTGWLQEQV